MIKIKCDKCGSLNTDEILMSVNEPPATILTMTDYINLKYECNPDIYYTKNYCIRCHDCGHNVNYSR